METQCIQMMSKSGRAKMLSFKPLLTLILWAMNKKSTGLEIWLDSDKDAWITMKVPSQKDNAKKNIF